MRERGLGYINSRAKSGYTSISLTKATRERLRELQDLTGRAADELIFELVRNRLEWAEDIAKLTEIDAARTRDSIESAVHKDPGTRDSIDRAPPSSETPEAR